MLFNKPINNLKIYFITFFYYKVKIPLETRRRNSFQVPPLSFKYTFYSISILQNSRRNRGKQKLIKHQKVHKKEIWRMQLDTFRSGCISNYRRGNYRLPRVVIVICCYFDEFKYKKITEHFYIICCISVP